MRKRKQPRNPRSEDLPTNPEFQRFAAFTGAVVSVPKGDIDRLLADEREAKLADEPVPDESTES